MDSGMVAIIPGTFDSELIFSLAWWLSIQEKGGELQLIQGLSSCLSTSPPPKDRRHLRWIFRLFRGPTWPHNEGAYIGWESEDQSFGQVWEESWFCWAPYPDAESVYRVPVTDSP